MSTSTGSGELHLRAAVETDCRRVWEINNEPSVRSQSIRQSPIPWEAHQTWFGARLQDPAARLLVAEVDGEVLGIVRLDLDADCGEATISIALASAARGRGVGTTLIGRASVLALDEDGMERVLALIRPDNEASLRAFTRAGYRPLGRVEVDGVELERFAFPA